MIPMSSNTSLDAIEVRVEKIEKEISDFKTDIKEEIKDIKYSIKENEKLFNDTMVAMKENITRLTVIADQQREEIKLIRESRAGDNQQDNKWYQDTFNKILLFLGVLILALLGLDVSGVDILK
ncbi:hypothetical protein QYF48_12260 [Brevibacillus agri]|uniref:hypothetical protein n=1 Tax=Brevibacillus agri TaxID=51101 RepID=UPI0025B6E80F|nr:hypothetical protein [Brevibacillus agri]MDN4093589.1 hypothetical protein [Brevibacillus agri]